jgi:hypothetical protein
MSSHLSPDQQRIVEQAIRAGLIRGPEDVMASGIEVLIDQIESHHRAIGQSGFDNWARELHDWIHSHSTATPLLTDAAMDRESIYGNRGI